MEYLLLFGCSCLLRKQMQEYHLKDKEVAFNSGEKNDKWCHFVLSPLGFYVSMSFRNTDPSPFTSIVEWRSQKDGQEKIGEHIFGSVVVEIGHHLLQRPLLFCGSVTARHWLGTAWSSVYSKWVWQLRLSVNQPQAKEDRQGYYCYHDIPLFHSLEHSLRYLKLPKLIPITRFNTCMWIRMQQ